jgi:hypothetical protein
VTDQTANPEHGPALICVATANPHGDHFTQTWEICTCVFAELRDRLGPPAHETIATADAVTTTVAAIKDVPGVVHHDRGSTP